MKFAFYFGHPAQFLFARETIYRLHNLGHQTLILIKKKDVLENLIQSSGLEYTNILPVERNNSRLATAKSLLKRNRKMYPILKKFAPDLLISSDASFAHLGSIMGIPRITILEDDYEVIKPLAKLTYPFTSVILCPEVCDVGSYDEKKMGYNGYMKLGYLHPDVFEPDTSIVRKYNLSENYAVIRLSNLAAYHDVDVNGLTEADLHQITSAFEKKSIQPLISAEGDFPDKFERFKMNIDPIDLHHILAHAKILVSDSQSMSVEAAMLGVPSLRYSDLAGRISVLEELESKYKLTFGFPTGQQQELIEQLGQILDRPDYSALFEKRRSKMLSDKINVSKYLTEFLTSYTQFSKKSNNQTPTILEYRIETERRA